MIECYVECDLEWYVFIGEVEITMFNEKQFISNEHY